MSGEYPRTYQSSVVTVFSLWNTMMGTTLLAIPWAIAQAGFTLGIFLILLIAGICFYTCSLVLRMAEHVQNAQIDGGLQISDFSDVCRYFIGRKFAKLVVVMSILTLCIAAIAYWILMSGFLFRIGESVTVFIANNAVNATNTTNSALTTFWTPSFIPLYLAAAIYPLTLFSNPAIFTKLNSFGVISVFYIIILVAVKAGFLGVHFDFCGDPTLRDFRMGFPALIGTMTMGFFLQNAVIAMTNPSDPKTRTRDLGFGYILVLITYLYIGITFYIVFPENKGTIQANFLNNFASDDVTVFVARTGLLLQMMTTYPLIAYITRLQFAKTLLGKDENRLFWRIVVGAVIICAGVLFAIFFPNLGTVLRISGALAGLTLAYTLPCIIYLAYLRREGKSTHGAVWGHLLIIGFGIFNFLAQFLL